MAEVALIIICSLQIRIIIITDTGLLDNVLSDYLWAKAVLLTTTTVATAGLTIQVPLAAVVDSLTGNPPHLMDYLGAVAVMIGFAGINIPSDIFNKRSKDSGSPPELEIDNAATTAAGMDEEHEGLVVSEGRGSGATQ